MFKSSDIAVIAAIAFIGVTGFAAPSAHAETPNDFLNSFQKEASGQAFSAARGETFFKNKHGSDWSCASCHTDNPAVKGKHAKSDKVIDPLAPAANAERFTDPKKVEKWFKRNCNDVLDRVCTPQEKGDVLAYLMTVK